MYVAGQDNLDFVQQFYPLDSFHPKPERVLGMTGETIAAEN
jgi:hypothetical protein